MEIKERMQLSVTMHRSAMDIFRRKFLCTFISPNITHCILTFPPCIRMNERLAMARFIKHFFVNLSSSKITLGDLTYPYLRDAFECDQAQVSNGQIPQTIFFLILLI